MHLTKTPLLIAIAFAILILVVTCVPLTLEQHKWLGQYDKYLHAITFTALTLCVAWSVRRLVRRRLLLLAVAGIVVTLFAATDEAIQLIVPSRTSDLRDMAANCLGILAGLLLFGMIDWWTRDVPCSGTQEG